MINLTNAAKGKLNNVFAISNPKPLGIRFAVEGGGCSGFQYRMAWWYEEDNLPVHLTGQDNVFDLDGKPWDNETSKGMKVFIENMSMLYLTGCEVDYIETLEGVGFKFNNPNVKSQCGCGKSFTV